MLPRLFMITIPDMMSELDTCYDDKWSAGATLFVFQDVHAQYTAHIFVSAKQKVVKREREWDQVARYYPWGREANGKWAPQGKKNLATTNSNMYSKTTLTVKSMWKKWKAISTAGAGLKEIPSNPLTWICACCTQMPKLTSLTFSVERQWDSSGLLGCTSTCKYLRLSCMH